MSAIITAPMIIFRFEKTAIPDLYETCKNRKGQSMDNIKIEVSEIKNIYGKHEEN